MKIFARYVASINFWSRVRFALFVGGGMIITS
jgi:hypothetical protein